MQRPGRKRETGERRSREKVSKGGGRREEGGGGEGQRGKMRS